MIKYGMFCDNYSPVVLFAVIGNKHTENGLNLIYWVLFSYKVVQVVHGTRAPWWEDEMKQKSTRISAKNPWSRASLFSSLHKPADRLAGTLLYFVL